jgi:type IV pilus assembly protein PilE
MGRTIIYRGFSLIEVMIVVAIVCIIATIGYPSYQESVRKAKRAEGRAALMQLMQQQERYYSQHSSYVAFSFGSVNPNADQFRWHSGDSAKKSAYEIHGEACAGESIANCVVLTARPGTANVDTGYTDPRCRRLMLSSTGRKTADGNDCW